MVLVSSQGFLFIVKTVQYAGSVTCISSSQDELNHSGDSGYLSNLDIIVCDTLKAMRKVAESLPPPAKRGKAANSFSLDALYRRFCGRRSNAHQAEQDCMDLLKVCHHDRKSFLAYVDANAVQFGTAVFPIR